MYTTRIVLLLLFIFLLDTPKDIDTGFFNLHVLDTKVLIQMQSDIKRWLVADYYESQAFQKVKHNEGGYNNDPHDPGGETYMGITRKNFPNWEGWSIIDASKPLKENQIIANQYLEDLVKTFYRVNFWEVNSLDRINSSKVASKILDLCVNVGNKQAIELVQRAVSVVGESVNEDGNMGPVTYNYINSLPEEVIYRAIQNEAISFYKSLVHKKPHLHRYLENWLQRANQ